MAAHLDNRLAHSHKRILRMLIVVPYERTSSAAAAPTGHAGPAAPAAEREDSTMKRTWMAVLTVAGFGLALATAADARPAPVASDTDALAACRAAVRRIEPRFDAYETPTSFVAFGSARARFEFFKCLNSRGVYTDPLGQS